MNKIIVSILVVIAFSTSINAQKNCEALLVSEQYFAASATGATESEARINALSALVENISSIVSSTTSLTTKDDRQTYSNVSRVTSVLRLKGVSYQTCNNKKDRITIVASISKADLEQSSAEVAARVRQYLELMEQKETTNQDFLPEVYTAYLHTFLSPYAIEYNSGSRRIGNVRDYLESYLRTYLSNIHVSCTGVRENPDYPDQQLTLSLALKGTKDTRMKFQVDLPEHNARGFFGYQDIHMEVIMAPDERQTKFNGTLTLAPPPVDSDLRDISDHVRISRDISFVADMSDVISLNFTALRRGNDYVLTPVARHLTIRQFEWLSGDRVVSTEQLAHIPVSLKEITLRVNGSADLVITKTLDDNSMVLSTSIFSHSIQVEVLPTSGSLIGEAREILQTSGFPEDAVVLVKSDIPGLTFRSSMSAIDRQGYNSLAGRYEIFIKPVKQLFSAESDGIEKSIGVINPQPKEVVSFRVNRVLTESQPNRGLVSITSTPPDASIFINDIESAYRTPFTTMVPGGFAKISLRRKYYESVDTVIRVDGSSVIELSMTLRRMPGYAYTDDALGYLRDPRERNYYFEPETDPVKLAAQKKADEYRMQKLKLQRRAVLYYTTGSTFLLVGAYYHWIDRMLYDKPNESTLSKFGNASYIVGGVGIVAGIIYSVKLSHLKKNWSVEPAPDTMGVGIAYKLK